MAPASIRWNCTGWWILCRLRRALRLLVVVFDERGTADGGRRRYQRQSCWHLTALGKRSAGADSQCRLSPLRRGGSRRISTSGGIVWAANAHRRSRSVLVNSEFAEKFVLKGGVLLAALEARRPARCPGVTPGRGPWERDDSAGRDTGELRCAPGAAPAHSRSTRQARRRPSEHRSSGDKSSYAMSRYYARVACRLAK